MLLKQKAILKRPPPAPSKGGQARRLTQAPMRKAIIKKLLFSAAYPPLEGAGGGFKLTLLGRGTLPLAARRYFFCGIFANISSKCFQNLSTVGISILSSGECTPCIVGPKEIISNEGYLSRNNPHSSPA